MQGLTAKKYEMKKVYDYTLFTSEKIKTDFLGGRKVYSLLVQQSEDGITTDYCFLYDVSREKNRALELLRIMKKNKVCPKEAVYVLQNLI